MDWDHYRARCDEGDVASRWLLERTAGLLRRAGEARLADRLAALVGRTPLSKPVDHRGGPETDFIELDLDADEAARIAAVVAALAADPGMRLDDGRGLGGLPEAWGECAAWLDGTHPRSPHGRAR